MFVRQEGGQQEGGQVEAAVQVRPHAPHIHSHVAPHLRALRRLGQHALPSPVEILELENPGVVGRQVLSGVPGGGPETFEAAVFLEPEKSLN